MARQLKITLDLDAARRTYDDLRLAAEIRRAEASLLRKVLKIVAVVEPAKWEKLADALTKLTPGLCPACTDTGTTFRNEPCPQCILGRIEEFIELLQVVFAKSKC